MAVYKATYCYPFLNSLDIRVTPTPTESNPRKYFKCKVDTSNKNVTGYHIKVLDHDNNVVFSGAKISPILELPQTFGDGINSGVNGTYLYIPFFQNEYVARDSQNLGSYNAVYYKGRFSADYVIQTSGSGSENITYWNYSNNGILSYPNWNGQLNGELVSNGDIVLSLSSDANKGGLWVVRSDGTLERFIDAASGTEATYGNLTNSSISINKGKYNTCVYTRATGAWAQDTTSVLWDCIASDNTIQGLPDFKANGSQYKWVITLYQGPNLTGYQTEPGMPGAGMLHGSGAWTNNAVDPYYVNYDNLPVDWFDMTLNSGTILGSNASRIQIADDATSDNPVLPGEGSTDPVVLKGNYIQFVSGTGADASLFSSRAYIETYDTSFGHVYPIEGSFTEDFVKTATYCRFYKYSNVDSEIKAQEIVEVADNSQRSTVPQGLITIGNIAVQQGNLVLLLNMTPASLNGIYIVNSDTFWTRGAFNTWGDYIGKVIYVKRGTFAGRNFQSQARAGGILDIPTGGSSSNTGTSLYFNEEQPIIIFPNKVQDSITYYVGTSGSPSTSNIDGYKPQSGDTTISGTILYKFNGSSWTSQRTVVSGSLYKVLQGSVYGNKVIKVGTTTSASNCDFTSSTAAVLHNTTTSTYIKPYSGLTKDMIVYLLNNKTVTIGGSVKNYIKITGVVPKVWRIYHSTLSTPLESVSNTDQNIPFHYEIRSFFKESDENPFSSYCDPYIKLGTPDEGWADIPRTEKYRTINAVSRDWEDFLVKTNQEFYVKALPYSSVEGISTRYITLYGFYFQAQQQSWEAYRWVLYDKNGEILQDTGKKYNRDMKVTFYGLTGGESTPNMYYASLIVDDALGNNLVYTTKIYVKATPDLSLGTEFTAKYDCNSHAVLLNYESDMTFAPSVSLDGTDYIYVNGSGPSYLWDNSAFYRDSKLEVTGKGGVTTPPVYDLTHDDTGMSRSVRDGVTYSHYFNSNSNEIDSDKHILHLINNGTYESSGGFLFSEEIYLEDNDCGKFLTLEIERPDGSDSLFISLALPNNFSVNSGTYNLQNTLNSNRNKIKYTIFNHTDELRTGYLKADSSSDYTFMSLTSIGSLFYLQNDPNINGNYEFLHYTAFPSSGSGLPSATVSSNYYPYYVSVNNNTKALNSKKFLGNCCLISNASISTTGRNLTITNNLNTDEFSRNAPCFWLEDHPEIRIYKSSSMVLEPINMIYGTDDYIYTGDALIYWPSAETTTYWNEVEGYTPTEDVFNSWEDILETDYSLYDGANYVINGKNSNIFIMHAYNRHPGILSGRKFRINIRCYNIDDVAEGAGTFDNQDYGSTNLGYSITEIKYNNATVLKFEIKEVG